METTRSKVKRLAWVMCLIGVFALIIALKRTDDRRFHIYFFDVGQGDSVFIETPENHQILIDGGPGNTVMKELAGAMGFLDRKLDVVILTHPHADHVEGLVEVVKEYEVGTVMFTGVVYENSYYNEFLQVIKNKQIPVIFANESSDFVFDSVVFDVIYPFDRLIGEKIDNANNASIVLKVTYDENSVLLTGDAEKEIENLLVDKGGGLEADILKVGHHGSKTSSTPDFLARVKPAIAVIQCGINNMFGHPHPQTLENLNMAGVSQIYRNDRDGTIELSY